jgi:hypothetical protein
MSRWGLADPKKRELFDDDEDKCCIVKKLLGGVCKKRNFVNNLRFLEYGFEDLNDGINTFPGHQGYGSTLAHTSLPIVRCSLSVIRFQKLIRLINVFWKQPLSLN